MQEADRELSLDMTLVAAVAEGDQEAFGALYDRHSSRLLGVAIAILRSRREAEDLLHDVFMELWQKARQYDARRGTVAFWLLLRTRSRAIDRQRMLRRKVEVERQASQDAAVLQDTTHAPEYGDLSDYLDTLPAPQREAIILSYLQGYSCREIAAMIKAPVPTVKSRLQSALRKMRAHYAVAMEGTQ